MTESFDCIHYIQIQVAPIRAVATSLSAVSVGLVRLRSRARPVVAKAINHTCRIIVVNLAVGIEAVVIGVTGRYRA